MTAVPTSRTWVAGEIVTAAYMNNTIRDVQNWLLAPAIFRGYQNSTQTLTTAVYAAINIDTEVVDSTGMHSIVTNTPRVTAVYPGWYSFAGGVSYAANATGRRGIRWAVNGTAINGSASLMFAGGASAVSVPARPTRVFLNVGDYAEMYALQESGGNLATLAATENTSSVDTRWDSN